MPIQIKRHLIILALLILIFIVARHLLIPESFGDLGHYRANSLGDNELLEMHYAGQEACTDCHEEVAYLKETDQHKTMSCESCHGPSYMHCDDMEPSKTFLPTGRDFCLKCHAFHSARKQDIIIQIESESHYPEYDCKNCHNPHAPWELKDPEQPEENL
jgi:hypothetical protein